jgi:peptidyl-prolyl cis-trans isomerase D
MLTFFRRIINSKAGFVITFIVLGVIALAFAAGDVTGLSGSGGGLLGGSVATVGGESVGNGDIRKRAQDELRFARQQQPDLDMAQYVASGGVEAMLQRVINGLALNQFGKDQGMRVGRALVGSELKAIPAFRGPTGQFDQTTYERLIAQRGMTDGQVQSEIGRETMAQFLMVPTIGASQVPMQMALPYASLLLERRAGKVALIPDAAVAPTAAPTDAEVQQYYGRNVARYTIPERRIMRYAIVTPDAVKAQVAPSDADIAKAYAADKTTYAPRQLRSATVVTVLDEKAAQALAARVKAGTKLEDAARAAGLESRAITEAEQKAIASQTSDAVASAIFAAPNGGIVGPARSSIGFVVARVDGSKDVPGRSLAEARDEIVTKVTAQNTAAALQKRHDAVDDALADNANINEVLADQKLVAQTTVPLLSDGTNPDAPGKPDPALTPIVAAGFAAEEGDTPTSVPTGPDGSFAVVALDRVVPAAPMPLAKVRDRVMADLRTDRARRAARAAANALLAKVNAGTPLAVALSQSGLKVPAPQSLASTRAQVNADPQRVNPVLALLFSMKKGTARLLESPEAKGWLVVQLDEVVPGDARKQPGVINATRGDLGRVIGREYAIEFSNAVTAHVGVKRNKNAIAQLKKDLVGAGGSDQ